MQPIRELVFFISLVGLICWLVVRPFSIQDLPEPMTTQEYQELDTLEQRLIGCCSLKEIVAYEQLIIKRYRSDGYDPGTVFTSQEPE